MQHAKSSKPILSESSKHDYYHKWVTEDVAYIISPEEESVFKALSTPEEKEAFIEQFWMRRNPDPTRAVNEFKEEHYRRIAYANSRFSCALPGWKTDRGRIYILHGPPSEIESYPQGGTHYRPRHEGGGVTMTYPHEVWRYNYLEGVGSNIELEFVDPTFTREYRLATHASDKDALFRVADLGLTTDEAQNLSTKQERRFLYRRMQDNPFQRYRTLTQLQRPPQIKHQELREIVRAGVHFESLPFGIQQDCFLLDPQHLLLPVTLEVDKSDLTLRRDRAFDRARVAIYGVARNLLNEILSEFEQEVEAAFPAGERQGSSPGRVMFQKMIVLRQSDLRCRLDLVVKDLYGGRVGHLCTPLSVISPSDSFPFASSLVLSRSIRKLTQAGEEGQEFVWGDLEIIPNPPKRFSDGDSIHVYFHLYNIAVDQATSKPALSVTYRILQEGRTLKEFPNDEGESVHFSSAERSVLVKRIPIEDLTAGKYRLSVEVRDKLANQTVHLAEEFERLLGTSQP
ncbi:MAG: GWxTD domain-containing protein [Acidobacteria bacterium]|nr:GWxTD domain-containing protein [Acidobacteriota bacterium]